jgi:F-type H+-transporting ATPase subunit epsilon
MPMSVQVVTPDREVLVADDATFVLAHGIDGDVGILPGHAPLMIGLGAGPLRIDRGDVQEWMIADGGFLQVSENQVIVLGEYVVLAGDVNVEAVRAEIPDLERQLSSAADEEAAQDLRRRLARAQAVVHAIERM